MYLWFDTDDMVFTSKYSDFKSHTDKYKKDIQGPID